MYNVEVIEEARKDLHDAYQWYEEKRIGLGEDFLNSFAVSTELLQRNPIAFEVVYKDKRRILMRRFPYLIIYEILNKTIYVIAVIHSSRHPQKWKKRNL